VSADCRVRRFVDDDTEAVTSLWRRVFPDDPARNAPSVILERRRSFDPELFLVAETHGRVVGAAIFGWDGHRGWVYHLAVDPGRQRAGIGAALMREGESRLAARGCPKLNLQVIAGNQDVVAFYEGLGYAVEPRISMGKIL
jgi:ribosomal protein S18 acetylase RimI-like enzyme